jgi:hypothetical protein
MRDARRLLFLFFLGASVSAALLLPRTTAAQLGQSCGGNSAATGCWQQLTNANFKDFAVGDGLVCLVGGNVMPATTTDEYLHPNKHSTNQGNEDVIECHKSNGASGISNEPFYPGHNGVPDIQTRFPSGVYDDGVWGGTPTGVIALYGPGGDDIAVLDSNQNVYVAAGDHNAFYTGDNYKTWTYDRSEIDANTGKPLCLKGLTTEVPPVSQPRWVLLAIGCNGEVYAARDTPFKGWLLAENQTFKSVAGGNTWFYGLTSSNAVYAETYRFAQNLPALPAGSPIALGDQYVISTAGTGSRIFHWNLPTSSWTSLDSIGYPYDGVGELLAIGNGQRLRGKAGEVIVWTQNYRVYLYAP